MDLAGTNVQDENLVDDQMNDAVANFQADAPAAAATVYQPTAPAQDAPAAVAEPAAPAVAPVQAPAPAAPVEPVAAADEDEDGGYVETPSPYASQQGAGSQAPSFDLGAHAETGTGDDDELLDLKQEALQQLTPLVDHLSLPADQKFDTLMMIIRASDDKRLIKPAYAAAQEIQDEDRKAQALLDVINEINYLTQPEHHDGQN